MKMFFFLLFIYQMIQNSYEYCVFLFIYYTFFFMYFTFFTLVTLFIFIFILYIIILYLKETCQQFHAIVTKGSIK